MHVRFVMEEPPPGARVSPTTSRGVVEWRLRQAATGFLGVVDAEERWRGAITEEGLTTELSVGLMDGVEDPDAVPVVHPDDTLGVARDVVARFPGWITVPVLADGRWVGIVRVADLDADRVPTPAPWPFEFDALHETLIHAMFSGLFILDAQGVVRILNPRGADILGVAADQVVGRPYVELAEYIFPHMADYLASSLVPQLLSGALDHDTIDLTLVNGREVQFQGSAVRLGGRLRGVVATFSDVTALRRAEQQARREADEAEKAFGLTLPNSKVETKLKGSPEYQDVYDPASGLATVKAVVPDGTYRHVINGLRIMAELHAIGLFQLVGVDKDTLVSAFIFHDVGKEQPRLRVGEQFRPRDTFEPSRHHAERSADWALKYYNVSPDAALLIRHHHTPDDDLPPDFPTALRPMLRVMKLVDGLSAGLTRRLAAVGPFELVGTELTVREYNRDARYHRVYRLALLSGRETPLHEEHPPTPTLGDPDSWPQR